MSNGSRYETHNFVLRKLECIHKATQPNMLIAVKRFPFVTHLIKNETKGSIALFAILKSVRWCGVVRTTNGSMYWEC